MTEPRTTLSRANDLVFTSMVLEIEAAQMRPECAVQLLMRSAAQIARDIAAELNSLDDRTKPLTGQLSLA